MLETAKPLHTVLQMQIDWSALGFRREKNWKTASFDAVTEDIESWS